MKAVEKVVAGHLKGTDSIQIHGPFDFCDEAVMQIVNVLIGQEKSKIAFDLSKCTYLTSPGISCMIKVIKRLQEIEGQMFIYGATEDMSELLAMARLDKYIKPL